MVHLKLNTFYLAIYHASKYVIRHRIPFQSNTKITFHIHHYIIYGQNKRQEYGNLTKAATDTFRVCSHLFHPC